jgi:hypothetical protein
MALMTKRSALLLTLAIWASLIAVGCWWSVSYAFTSGQLAEAPTIWPSHSLTLKRGGFTMVVFLHPRCKCSVATMEQIEKIVSAHPRKLFTYFIFTVRGGAEKSWMESDLLQRARRVENAEVLLDSRGLYAAEFGAYTSGEAILYGKNGKRRFYGGVTISRGHSGESPGTEAIEAILEGYDDSESVPPVFGCSL